MMDNAEEVMHSLEEFSKLKPKVIPRELEDYLGYVAKTGDPVFKWSMVKFLFREKMLSVINDFYEDTLTIDLPPCPNVDVFNYDRMKTSLLERLESFHGAPFTVQRICELLTNPRKEYNRADKFMRAIEKNILVVSTREPGRYADLDCENTQECSINGIRESSDSLDTAFIINDLGPGPDSSSPSSELHDGIPDANHLSTVARVSPVHDQEVSSDSDDNSVENCRISADESSERVNGIESENNLSLDEADGSNVSSTDMSFSLSANSSSSEVEDESPETISNSVTSTHSNMDLDQQPGTFVADHGLGEAIASVEHDQDDVEPCSVSEGIAPNEIVPETEATSHTKIDQTDDSPGPDKSDLPEDTSELQHEKTENQSVNSISNIVAVECDTSQSDSSTKHDDSPIESDTPSIPDCSEPCDSNDQITACDTTELSNSELLSGFQVDSGEVQAAQSDISQSEMIGQSDNLTPSEATANPDNTAQSIPDDHSEIAQSDIVAQSDEVQTEADRSEQEPSNADPVDETQSDTVAQSDEVVSQIAQSDKIAQSDIVDQSNQIAQSDYVEKSSNVVDSGDTAAQSSIIGESCDAADSEIAQSADSESMAQSSTIDQSDSTEPGECQSQNPDQTEQVVLMDIPSDSENTTLESNQSAIPLLCRLDDCASSEPMDVDE